MQIVDIKSMDNDIRGIIYVLSAVWILYCMNISSVNCQSNTGVEEYCNQETFNASCPDKHVIIMTSALYGRMRFGRCMKEDHGHEGCHVDVLPYLDEQCSGRMRCDVPVPLAPYSEHPNCPSELMSYLEAGYKCQRVEANRICPRTGSATLNIGVNATYLTPPPNTMHSYPGSRNCPWIIEAEKGRRINITFISFTAAATSLTSGSSSAMQCSDFLVIRDYNTTENRPICRDQRREKLLYSTKSNKVTIYLRFGSTYNTDELNSRYLLKTSAVGCKDVTPMTHAWIRRTDDVTVVKCNHTGETFFLSCMGAHWLGELHNCSKGSLTGHHPGDPSAAGFNYGFLLVIGIGVALGVALGIILLAAILTCFRRKKHAKPASHHTSDPLLTNDTHLSEDANSNYYERRSLATIGRSPHTIRDSVYSERVHFAPHGATDPNMAIKCQTLPFTGRKVENRDQPDQQEIYCTCPQGAATIYGRNLARGGQSSFITFKPENEQVDVYGALPDPPNASRTHSDTHSLDLIRESESQNLENMQRASLTPQLELKRYNCNKCGVSISTCPCARNGTATMPRLSRQSTDPSMSNNKSV